MVVEYSTRIICCGNGDCDVDMVFCILGYYNGGFEDMNDKLGNSSGHYRRYRSYDYVLDELDEKRLVVLLEEIERLRIDHDSGIDVGDKLSDRRKDVECIFSIYRMRAKRIREEEESRRISSYFG